MPFIKALVHVSYYISYSDGMSIKFLNNLDKYL
nr:MAG TPA: hypothetical protein [Caudoviricetes sp.]